MEQYPSLPLGHVNTIFKRKKKTWVLRVSTLLRDLESPQKFSSCKLFIGSGLHPLF